MPHDISRTTHGARRVATPDDAEYRSCHYGNSTRFHDLHITDSLTTTAVNAR